MRLQTWMLARGLTQLDEWSRLLANEQSREGLPSGSLEVPIQGAAESGGSYIRELQPKAVF
jgi:hypothetical protein